MQRIIQQITQQFVDLLPENDEYYRLDELRTWGLPSFIVRRIKIELERNMAESMIIPKTDWANTQSDAVVNAWQNFVDAIRAEARLPASYSKTVIETAVADVIEMLVQPRRNIPEVIFGTDDELTADEIYDRSKAVVVYPHFSRLVPRYMQKKNMDILSKEHCSRVITKADDKLVKSYSPLNWAQMLEPLFGLMNGNIDTNLLRLFFEDKGMNRIARKFDSMNDILTRAEFIEVLSSPELLDFEGYEEEQSSPFADDLEAAVNQDDSKSQKDEELPKKPVDEEPEHEKGPEEDDDSDDDLPDKEQISAMLFSDENGKEVSEDNSLNSSFVEWDGQLDHQNDTEEEEKDSLNAVFRDEDDEPLSSSQESKKVEERKGHDQRKESTGETIEDTRSGAKAEKPQKNGHKKGSEEETPIWMRYMSDEELAEYEKKREREETDEDGFIEEPIIDLTQENASGDEIKKLKKLLKSDRELFVEEIFRGSERAFEEAVEDIVAYESWRDVSKYIEKDIFKRNLVDMYSEVAVDFTDRLQTYFLEKQN